MSDKQTYDQYRSEVKAEQAGKDYDQIKAEMDKSNDFITELDNLKPQNHIWVDRGAVLSCEDAGHPNHHAFKRLR